MNETRELLERVGDRFTFPDRAFERLERRRDRKRRNQRIAAGFVGIAVFVAVVLILGSVNFSERSHGPAGGVGTRSKTTVTIRIVEKGGLTIVGGDVQSKRPFKCASGRRVILFQRLGPEEDPRTDFILARVRASLSGGRYRWRAIAGGFSFAERRVYALVKRTEFCGPDTSRTLRI